MGGKVCVVLCLHVQKAQIYVWDGRMPLRWRKLENFKLELPRETLLSVEVVQELKGEVTFTGPNVILMYWRTELLVSGP